MSLDDWHLVFVSVCLAVVLLACAPLVMAYMPSRDEPFFELAVLGEEGKAEHYYPDDDPSIRVGNMVHWTVYLYNHMGETQYIAVRVKLLNSTTLAPNSTSCTPSPAPVVYEFRRVLLYNETWLFPFSWAILDIEKVGNFSDIRSLSVNGETIETHALALHESEYRIVLELWVYNKNSNDFEFGWVYDDGRRCAWNQLWFDVVSNHVS